jgi:hypothetical protein
LEKELEKYDFEGRVRVDVVDDAPGVPDISLVAEMASGRNGSNIILAQCQRRNVEEAITEQQALAQHTRHP